MVSAFVGGVIFNASNILLSASVSMAGMAVAFPLGVGLALVLGVFINYFSAPKGNPLMVIWWGFFLWWLPLSVMEWLQVRSRIVVLLGAGKGLF